MKKGFTLVELLAVIVILAIIALIATPIIINIITDAKEASALRSAEGYMRAVENKVALSNLKEPKITDGIYNVKDENIKAEYSGNGPTIGSITITNGIVSSAKLCIDNVSIDYEENENKLSSNNYCLKNELVVDDEEIKNEQNLSSLTIDKKEGTNIICNNGVTITEVENNKIKIDNIVGKVDCKFSNSVIDSVKDMDDTKNYMLMLNNETTFSTLDIGDTKNLFLDLNKKTITYNSNNFAIKNSGILNIIGEGATLTGGNSIQTLGNSRTNINGGTYNYIKITTNSIVTINNTINKCSTNGNNCYTIFVNDESNVTLNNITTDTVYNIEDGNEIKLLGKSLGLNLNSNVTVENSKFYCGADNCIWDDSLGNLNITDTTINSKGYGVKLNNSGYLKIENSEITSSTLYAVSNESEDGNVDIINSVLKSINEDSTYNINRNDDHSVFNRYNGTINITNSELSSNGDNYAVINYSNGTININGGIYESDSITIMNLADGTININDNNGKTYIASYETDEITDRNKPKAIKNNKDGNIYISGKVADKCSKNKEETTEGICIYNEFGRAVVNDAEATGNIKINGGYIVSDDYVGVENYIGNIYICSSKINGKDADIRINRPANASDDISLGYIYYNDKTELTNNKTSDQYNDPSHIIKNENLVCTN